jgi:hypothetical protein
MNKHIDGAQCILVLWHKDVVTSVIEMVESEFGKEAPPLTVTRVKVHVYLGMTIDYSTEGKVRFSLIEYIKDILDELSEDREGKYNSCRKFSVRRRQGLSEAGRQNR